MKTDTSVSNQSDLLEGKPSDWFQRIAIVRTDVQRQDFPTEDAYIAEEECIERSEQVAELLRTFRVEVEIIPADSGLGVALQQFKPDLCINFVDTVRGSGALASGIPGIFDLQNIRYVGAGTLALSLNTNKFLTKTLLENWDIPTPHYQLFRSAKQEVDYDFRYPVIVKLNEEHGSVGITSHSVVTNEKQLRERVSELLELYKQPVLVEEFIDGGREITAVVIESTQNKVFLSERVYEQQLEHQFKLVTFDTKWATSLGMAEPVEYAPFTTMNTSLIAKIKADARQAFEVLRMDDLGRFDVMLDKYDNYFFIDCNANPSLGPESSVARAVAANNQKFETVMLDILKRNRLDQFQDPK